MSMGRAKKSNLKLQQIRQLEKQEKVLLNICGGKMKVIILRVELTGVRGNKLLEGMS